MDSNMRPGGGGRFDALREALRRRGVKNPEGLAATIGRAKYGKAKFQKMAARGRNRKA